MSGVSGPPSDSKEIKAVLSSQPVVKKDGNSSEQKTPEHKNKDKADEKVSQKFVRDPAVSISASVGHLSVGENIQGTVQTLDSDGRPILVTPEATFAMTPDVGLEKDDRIHLQVTAVKPGVTAKLLLRNDQLEDPPKDLTLTLVSVKHAELSLAEQLEIVQGQSGTPKAISGSPYGSVSKQKAVQFDDTAKIPFMLGNVVSQNITDKESGQNIAMPIAEPKNMNAPDITSTKEGKLSSTSLSTGIPGGAMVSGLMGVIETQKTNQGQLVTGIAQNTYPGLFQMQIPEYSPAGKEPSTQISEGRTQHSQPINKEDITSSASAKKVLVTLLPAESGLQPNQAGSATGNVEHKDSPEKTWNIDKPEGGSAATLLQNIPKGTIEAKITVVRDASLYSATVFREEIIAPDGKVPQNGPNIHLDTTKGPVEFSLPEGSSPPVVGDKIWIAPVRGESLDLVEEERPAQKENKNFGIKEEVKPLQTVSQGLTTWPVMDKIVDLITEAEGEEIPFADVAGQSLADKTVRGPTGLTGSMLFMLSALKKGNISQWLGPKVENFLRQQGQNSLLEMMKKDLEHISTAYAQGATVGEWQPLMLPVVTEDDSFLLALLLRPEEEENYDQDEKGDEEEEEEDKPTRFVLEVHLSALGPLQLDGLVRGSNFDLRLRTLEDLPKKIPQDIQTLFTNALDANGFTGGIAFETVEKFPVDVNEVLKSSESKLPHQHVSSIL